MLAPIARCFVFNPAFAPPVRRQLVKGDRSTFIFMLVGGAKAPAQYRVIGCFTHTLWTLGFLRHSAIRHTLLFHSHTQAEIRRI
jgi:hypothetical protein